ncbi:hypothetical protein K7640_04560 [Micromonospora sp. PLK6-60]|uniref:hypothetical protein n=1 Tax=Micromonospora sp. PLK6-60 TaxID=2873383 RepID=UPI001CA6D714|nr:hypothetical protein [Micromonospora sp. PLK6-60]MBY8871116.1 hypothetical protein [Micromonospora sp. PLK6-60]
MSVSLPVALALLAIVVAAFALLAVLAVYARLRQAERVIADLTFGSDRRSLPESLRPGPGVPASVLLTLDGECPTCHELARAAAASDWSGLRVVRLFSSAAARDRHAATPGLETVVDPDTWAAVYEGYTPTVTVVDAAGTTVHRRFVYADNDMTALLAEARDRGRGLAGQVATLEAS